MRDQLIRRQTELRAWARERPITYQSVQGKERRIELYLISSLLEAVDTLKFYRDNDGHRAKETLDKIGLDD